MDLLSIGSVNSYVKTIDMQAKWQHKKSSGDLRPDGISSVSEWVAKQKEKIDSYSGGSSDENGNKNDHTLSQIMNKYNNGGKLTPSEMSYIQKKDPASYQKIKDAEAAAKQYENELKKCRTKEDVQKLRMSHSAQSVCRVNSIKNDPYITPEKKLEFIMQEKRKNDDIENITREYVKTGEYASLPTDAECRRAEHELQEAKKEQLSGKDKDTELREEEIAEENKVRETLTSEVNRKDAAADGETKDSSDKKLPELKRDMPHKKVCVKKKKVQTVKKKAKSVYEAENSDEARKVRRARARKAYTAAAASADMTASAAPKIDGKA